MGCFHVDAVIRNIAHRGREEAVPRLLVDTGSERTWVPGEVLERLGVTREKKDLVFMMANGQQITRSVGVFVGSSTPTTTNSSSWLSCECRSSPCWG